jgi:hypothetical protein
MKRSIFISNIEKNKIYFNNKSSKNKIFREFEKKSDKFIATNHFFISKINDNNDIIYTCLNKNDKILKPYSNIYNDEMNNYIDLIVPYNISFTLDDININKHQILNKFLENDKNIDETLLNDLYCNNEFSKKINIELPKKYNNKTIYLENMDVTKKYLFKMNILELKKSCNQEYNKQKNININKNMMYNQFNQ